jgi:hypothetical protein
MGKIKARFFWVKTDGSIKEVNWEKFCDLRDKSQNHPLYRYRLVILEPSWIGFLQGIHYIQFPRKALEQILKEDFIHASLN